MSDNRRVYRRIESKLKQLFPKQLSGNQARHMNTLAAMITGIVQSKSCALSTMATKISTETQVASVEKKFGRFIQNENVSYDLFFLPFIITILQQIAQLGLLILAMDGSVTGRKCMTLMVSVIHNNRAIPIAWVTVKGRKGHLSEDVHLQLLNKVKPLIPEGTDVIFLGDGEHFRPPEIRTDLLKLHGLAMDVVNNGWDSQLGEMAELAVELEVQTLEMMQSLDALHQVLSKLTDLLPDDAFDMDN